MYWIYKCNSRGYDYQASDGDWAEVFANVKPRRWGSTEWVRELGQAKIGDTIIAYQTDRNELVGTARVTNWKQRGRHRDFYIKPVERIGARVRPLKDLGRRIAKIPALKPGEIKTL